MYEPIEASLQNSFDAKGLDAPQIIARVAQMILAVRRDIPGISDAQHHNWYCLVVDSKEFLVKLLAHPDTEYLGTSTTITMLDDQHPANEDSVKAGCLAHFYSELIVKQSFRGADLKLPSPTHIGLAVCERTN